MSQKSKNDSDEIVDINNSSGPSTFGRDKNGLLKTIQYSFLPDGSVDWRAMIKDEHLFPNRSWFESRKKNLPRTAEGLADYQLLIKLGGIKELARLRGFTDLSYDVVKCDPSHVAVICRMNFLPNYETDNSPISFQDMANASIDNTSSFATKFLETIACNRSFVRCVRNFLNVHIVGDDEIDKSEKKIEVSNANPLSPVSILEAAASEKLGCSTFKDFREELRKFWQNNEYRNESVKSWNKWDDIPPAEIRKLLSVINS
jgi:hypothetical protein